MKRQTMKKILSLLTAFVAAFSIIGSNAGGLEAAIASGNPAKLMVYDDRLSDEFANYSWANHQLGDGSTVHTGTSAVKLKPNGDDALYFYKDRILQVSDYPVFELWVNGGTGGGQQLEIVLQLGGQPVASKQLTAIKGEWQLVRINLAEMNMPGGIFDGILIRGTTGGEQADVYFDDLAFVWEAVLVGLAVSPSPVRLLIDDRLSLSAATVSSDGTNTPIDQGVAWKSGNEQVAIVQNGLVTGIKAGKTVLTASYENMTASVPVTVVDPDAQPELPQDDRPGITVYADTLSEAFADYSWANHDLSESSTVRSGSASIRMDPSNEGGLYLYKGNGSVNVKEHDTLEFWVNGGDAGGQQVELVFNSGGAPAAWVNLGSLLEGGTIPAGEWAKVSVDLNELQLQGGIFDGLLLHGTSAGPQGNLYLDDIRLLEKYVAPPTLLEGVLSQYGLVLAPGDASSLSYEARYSDGSAKDVTAKTQWTSSDSAIVTVDDKGALTAHESGLAKITARFDGGSSSMYVQVTGYTKEPAFTDALPEGYSNWSWGTNDFANPAPVASGTRSISFAARGYEGIWIHRDALMDLTRYYGLTLKLHGGSTGGQKLRVNIMNGRNFAGEFNLDDVLPNGLPANEWTEVKLKFADLGLGDLNFDGVVVSAWGEQDQGTVYVDDVNWLKTTDEVNLPDPELPGVKVSIDSAANRRTLSEGIFGVNFEDMPSNGASTMDFPIKRWGGNQMTRYNWQLDTTNRGGDWYFLNIPNNPDNGSQLPNGSLSDQFIADSKSSGTDVLLQVPTIGWTPKSRDIGWSFSIDKYGAQSGNECNWGEAWCRADAGTGRRADGSYVTGNDPTDTSKQVGTDFITSWIGHLQQNYGSFVHKYALDNEPMLWPHSHWDVHPQMTTYDEVWNYTTEYAKAIKQADPQAEIFGPVPWGWCEYFYSAKDGCSAGADMEAHDGKPYLEWYLNKVNEYKQQTGVALVDVLDIHYYPAENNVPFSSDESAAMTKRRFNSLKSLYDPNFTDPSSWIQEPVKLLPRMRDIIERNAPGTKLSISEYNFGDGTGIGSGLAQAEALAIFAREGVDYAMRWGALPADTPLEDAFKLFLDYDGAGSKIEGDVVGAISSNGDAVGAYTIVSKEGKTFILLFNKDTAARTASVDADLDLGGTAQVYRFDAKHRLAAAGTAQGGPDGLALRLPAKSATLIVMP
ncbi:glycoside hydrolase family 44 protein [Cohnella suwonensis]|uniref:Glycoside hydrolase family 44 protein n=1 Tax=Cohnella suwonensis TaxID=696072 RepID=A0ABW0M1U5_9BACL